MPPTHTPPQPETVPVIVIQHTPEPGEELALNGPIEVVFDRDMDRSSVHAAFEISPKVAGDFEWADQRTLQFWPSVSLERDVRYSVIIGAEAKATDGNPLGDTYRFHFRTVGYLEVAQVIPAPDTDDVAAES